jgi:hypothetical protein
VFNLDCRLYIVVYCVIILIYFVKYDGLLRKHGGKTGEELKAEGKRKITVQICARYLEGTNQTRFPMITKVSTAIQDQEIFF